MCPKCGETVFTGVNSRYEGRCDKCGTTWTLTELEIYEISHPDEETTKIVGMAMRISHDLARKQA